jgi:hypothetical protein
MKQTDRPFPVLLSTLPSTRFVFTVLLFFLTVPSTPFVFTVSTLG